MLPAMAERARALLSAARPQLEDEARERREEWREGERDGSQAASLLGRGWGEMKGRGEERGVKSKVSCI